MPCQLGRLQLRHASCLLGELRVGRKNLSGVLAEFLKFVSVAPISSSSHAGGPESKSRCSVTHSSIL